MGASAPKRNNFLGVALGGFEAGRGSGGGRDVKNDILALNLGGT